MSFSSFREIPGVTREETSAIETLQRQKQSFIVGMCHGTEAFTINGEITGFSALMCGWLSRLFGIEFVPQIYKFSEILSGIDSGEIDFTGSMTITPERLNTHFMAGPVTEHTLKYFRLNDSKPLSEIQVSRLPVFGLLKDSVVTDAVYLGLGHGTFEAVFIDDLDLAYDLLKSGIADAFINENDAEGVFVIYDDIEVRDFLPVFLIPIGFTTKNPELAPVISVFQKALDNGGTDYLKNLYNSGYNDFRRAVLFSQLTEEERLYIQNKKTIPYVTQYRNYPMSFYNERDKEWQGIAFDLLREIEELTGLSFTLAHGDKFVNWPDLLAMVDKGEAAFITELMRTDERKGYYIWPETTLASVNLTLVSGTDQRAIYLSEVNGYKVGVVRNTAQTETFKRWFPGHNKTTEYNDTQEAFNALGKKEIDLVMTDTGNLLTMTNYLELTGFKANIVFNEYSQDSSFGLNVNEIVLSSIMDKALSLIDIDTITENWRNRTFDYRYKLIEAQRPWLFGMSILLLFVIILLFILFQLKRGEGRKLETLVQTRTAELQKLQVNLEAALKEAQDANTAKSKFLATMSHEIRTPMNVILGVTDTQLSAETLPQKIKEAFEKIFDSGHLLLNIINDILDLSKIESGKFDLFTAKYETLSMINDAVNMNVMRIGHKQIQFKLKVDENIPQYLSGDELRIKQILNNLLSNAFKYTNSGEVSLSFISEDTEDKNKIILVFKISDTGQGMTPEQVSRLFDEYLRFNMEANRATVGTGLGMAITRNLVKLMNGEIAVDSTPGKGSVFTVRIPQEKACAEILGREIVEKIEQFNFSDLNREKSISITREKMPYGKVLVVDDMPSNLDIAKMLLHPYQLKVETAESGYEAIDMIKSGKEYDIIFMDHMMPVMDGIEAVRHIREWKSQAPNPQPSIPIIALTANAVAGQQDMFLENGFDGFISKPIDIRQMNDVLNRFIRDKKRAASAASLQATAAPQMAQSTTADQVPEPDNSADSNKIPFIGIPDVNIKAALALYDNSNETYHAVLRSFAANALSLVDKLREVTAETLPDYSINVHGLKGICASIGAEKIREAAFYLEKMSKAGNLDEVLAHNDELIHDTEILIAGIQKWLDENIPLKTKPVLPRPDRELLIRLIECCKNFDIDSIDDIMDEMEKSDYREDARLVTWLREKANESDFTNIVSHLENYLSEN